MKNPFRIIILSLAILLSIIAASPVVPAQTASATGVVAPRKSTLSSSEEVSRPRFAGSSSGEASGRGKSSSAITTSADLERRVFDLINAKRAARGAAPLSWSSKAAKAARDHSREMALYDYFSHTDIEGNLVDKRATDAGIRKWSSVGENIAYLRGYDDPALNAVERWLLSPSHRDNLLDARWKETGIGLAIRNDGTYFFTQVFVVE